MIDCSIHLEFSFPGHHIVSLYFVHNDNRNGTRTVEFIIKQINSKMSGILMMNSGHSFIMKKRNKYLRMILMKEFHRELTHLGIFSVFAVIFYIVGNALIDTIFAERPNMVILGVLLLVALGVAYFLGRQITDVIDQAVSM